MLDLDMRVTQEKLELLATGVDRVLKACRTSQNILFRTPRVRRAQTGASPYDVSRDDADKVTHDYESRAREQRLADSVVGELKQRMRGVLELRGATSFRDWSYGPGPMIRSIDVRDALSLAPPWANTMVPLTKKFQLVIGEDAMAALAPAINVRSSGFIRWCAKSDVIGVEARESRWWTDTDEAGDA